MLQLKKIKKDYSAGSTVVHALKGVDLTFRSSEFVSILGPSGCGKTTMLNIIGGLDQYTSGDLVINGRSTKDFKDRDWDTYRNHSIGFVFQSYNLIPHQSVLQNVELALTLSGVPKKERRARAKQALIDVGLDGQFKKLPSEMSGGQMQRVAIARALVNNPDIILADEPTGALDTETSVQVMDILKKISKDKLVIMVTHNPDLANKYSTRIINMLDGEITGDSNPLSDEEFAEQSKKAKKRLEEEKKMKKPSMSIFTSFGLSLKNLFTKKGRTVLTSFAGSIGIIGIALILAVSQGTTAFINGVQEETLSAYPLTLQAQTIEMSSLMEAFMNFTNEDTEHENDAVYKKAALYNMISAMNNLKETKNDLKSFKAFLEKEMKENEELDQALNGVQYSYDLDLHIYTKTVDGTILRADLEEVIASLIMENIKGFDITAITALSEQSGMSSIQSMGGMGGMGTTLWQELLPAKDGALINPLIYEQYDKIYGEWPNSYDEIVLVVDKNNELDDVTLYSLGLLPKAEIDNLANAALYHEELDDQIVTKWSYEDICNQEYKVILNSQSFAYNEITGTYVDLREDPSSLLSLYNNALTLKVTGIIRPSDRAQAAMLQGRICYTSALTKHVIDLSKDSDILTAQTSSPNTDIFSGRPFSPESGKMTDEQKAEEFKNYISTLDTAKKAQLFQKIFCTPTEEELTQYLKAKSDDELKMTIISLAAQRSPANAEQIQEMFMQMTREELDGYINTQKELKDVFRLLCATEKITKPLNMTPEDFLMQSGGKTLADFTVEEFCYILQSTPEQLAMQLDGMISASDAKTLAFYYDETMEFSESTYENNLKQLGYVDIDSPAAINLFASSFENKDVIVDAITKYNEKVEELKRISYTDFLGIMMSSVTIIIDAITYVLIAFVSISLIVSSIMIGVITLISVQERTKEIGILRAIGASKGDVSGMFNAETMIVGFSAGLLGVIVTYLLCIPINYILRTLTGLANLKAILPINAAVILVLISVVLTLISGLIPSRSAAKKDPVVALRTE